MDETVSKKLNGVTEQKAIVFIIAQKYPVPNKVKFTMPAIQSKLPAIKRKKKVWPTVREKFKQIDPAMTQIELVDKDIKSIIIQWCTEVRS